jgi:hypothetical protein
MMAETGSRCLARGDAVILHCRSSGAYIGILQSLLSFSFSAKMTAFPG